MKAIRVSGFDEAIKAGPGAFYYEYDQDAIVGMTIVDPNSTPDEDGDHMKLAGVSFAPGRWTFDGNLDEPSVTPSIFIDQPHGWHGYLTKGEWVRA